MNRREILAAMAASSLGMAPAARAQGYPSSPVRMIVPYAAGGGADAVARLLGQSMADELRQVFNVDNRPGAGGMLGADAAAKAAPDGYTLLLAGNPELTITPSLAAKVPYSPLSDFKPIALISQSPNVLVAAPALGAKTLRAALDAARKLPGGITIGTPGNGSPQHIAVEVMRTQLGLDLVHVPYKGAAPAVIAAIGGEVSFALVGAPPLLSHLAANKLVALAVTQPQRSPLVPSVPTMGEAMGVMQDDDFVTWYGLLAPSKTPSDVVSVLEKAAFAVLKRTDMRSRLATLGTDLVALPADAFTQRMRAESKVYADIIKRFGIKVS
ncbi:Bug family tripartite tricarboxylate transporter substrate binding protein [Azohydromonas australica]|uniref:Bug family tripartite tricarboxylate transporter substrate binding protein n=1 Tax=Azohydromonas australica TaxID=364039 RepID=UPI00040F102C|nr:tripartite tricarboxylate transporter substrate-binding protein [Azohydromonas australica]